MKRRLLIFGVAFAVYAVLMAVTWEITTSQAREKTEFQLSYAAIDLYDTTLFTLDQVADWEWIEGETQQVLHQKPGFPTYTATIAKYCDLMCALPGGIARLNGVAAPEPRAVLVTNAA